MANSDSLLPYPRWASPSEAATYGKIGTIDAPAYSCVGFAMMAHWFIYAQKNTDNVAAEHIATINLSSSSAQTNLTKYAREGDMLVFRTSKTNGNYSHAAIYTGCTSSAVKVLDSNWGGSTGNTCKMQEHTISYSTYAYVEISRATNATDETVAVTSVSLATTEINLGKGNTYALSATVSPSNATNKAVTWSSSNTAVATVSSSGVVKGIAPGQATITATTKDGGHKATCSVTVSGDVYTITYDLNGGTWGQGNTQAKNEGEDLILVDETPSRPGYTFLGWESLDGIVTEGEWVTEKPANGDYETGYKYYTYGYEYNSDYTYAYGPNKNTVWSSSLGTYSAAKLRYFWLIESTNHGESFYPAKTGNTASNFKAPYLSETGAAGTATIRNTNFYFESVVYKQDTIGFPVYQPGETFKRDENVTLSAIWMEGTGDSSIPTGNTGDCYWRLEDGILMITGSGAMGNYSNDSPAPWNEYKDDITTITIRDGVTHIGEQAFYYCTNVTTVNIADSVMYIESSAFCGCANLTNITLPKNLKSLRSSAFHDCGALTSITIPASVNYIDTGVFNYCNSLTNITVAASNAYYSSIDGVLFDKDAKTLICYPGGKTETTYTVPDGVETIGSYDAFFKCNNLTSVVLPDSVAIIGVCAFLSSANITDITLGRGLTSIGDNAFLFCSSLSDIWYAGSEADSANIIIESGNAKIQNATWHYAETTDDSDTNDEELVADSRLESIELIALPDKLTYKAYYYIELDGAVLRLHFADGEQEDIILDRPFSYINNRAYYYSDHLQEIFTVSLNKSHYNRPGTYTASLQAFGHKATFNITVENLSETYSITNIENSFSRDTADDNVLIIQARQEDGSVINMKVLGYESQDGAPNIVITDQGVISGCFVVDDSWLSLSLHFDGDPYSGYGYTYGTDNSLGSYHYYTALLQATKVMESWRISSHYTGEITKENIDGIVETVLLLADAQPAKYSGTYIQSLIHAHFGMIVDLSMSEKYDASTDIYNGGPWYGDVSAATFYQMPIRLDYNIYTGWEYSYEYYAEWENELTNCRKVSLKLANDQTISEYHSFNPIYNASNVVPDLYVTQTHVRPNNTFEVNLHLPGSILVRSLGVNNIIYDAENLELIGSEWLLTDALLTDWDQENQIGAATLLTNTAIDGNIVKLTFRVKETATECDLNISLGFMATAMNGNAENNYLYSEKSTSVSVSLLDPMDVVMTDVNCRPGETIEILVSIPEATDIKTLGISSIWYDVDILELVGGEWLLDNSLVSDWNADLSIGALTFAENTTVSGNFFKLIFTVKEDAPDCITPIGCSVTAKQMVGNTEATILVMLEFSSVTITHILTGDMDGNEAVNSNDVVFLLYHTLFPSMYPANQNADFNHDGAVNSNDVIFLLYHTLFPSMYPLS